MIKIIQNLLLHQMGKNLQGRGAGKNEDCYKIIGTLVGILHNTFHTLMYV